MAYKNNNYYSDRPPQGGRDRQGGFRGGYDRKGRANDNFGGFHHEEQPIEENPYKDYAYKGNLGLLYTRRYYEGIDEKVLNKVNISIAKKDSNKPLKTNHQSIYYHSRNDNIIKQAKRFETPAPVFDSESLQFELTTIYPGLLIGTGILHGTGHEGETKLGLMFDHTTGLPYIPGSSLKGLLRSAFPMRSKGNDMDKPSVSTKKERREYIKKLLKKIGIIRTDIDIDNLELDIFGATGDEKCHEQGNDIFFDAFPVKSDKYGLLGLDYITPHKDEFSNPNPIQFMRVEPGVTFRFEFLLFDYIKKDETGKDNILVSAEKKKELFKLILLDFGIGAKTNVGYGQLK